MHELIDALEPPWNTFRRVGSVDTLVDEDGCAYPVAIDGNDLSPAGDWNIEVHRRRAARTEAIVQGAAGAVAVAATDWHGIGGGSAAAAMGWLGIGGDRAAAAAAALAPA